MRIPDTPSEALRATRIGTTARLKPGSKTGEATLSSQPAAGPEGVPSSDARPAMAARSGEAPDELSPERVTEIRNRILEGAYESLPMVDQVARRILGSGDV